MTGRAICLVLIGVGACAKAAAPSAARVTFLGCEENVVTLDLSRDSVLDQWPLHRAESTGAIDSPQWDGCPVEAVAYDAKRNIAFLVLPDRTREDPASPKHFRIVSAQLPAFAAIASMHIAGSARPALLFDTHADRLIAQWTRMDSVPPGKLATGWPLTTMVLSSPSLQVMKRAEQRIPNTIDGSYVSPIIHGTTSFSPASRAIGRNRIVDADAIAEWRGDTLVAHRHGLELSQARQHDVQQHRGIDATHYRTRGLDAGERRLLVGIQVFDDTSRTMLIALTDIDNTSTAYPLVVAPRGHAFLLGDERRFLVQEVDGRLNQPVTKMRMTGRVSIFDGQTGTLVREIADRRLAGSFEIVQPICSTPDGNKVFMRTDDARLAIVDVVAGSVTLRDVMVRPADLCMFAS